MKCLSLTILKTKETWTRFIPTAKYSNLTTFSGEQDKFNGITVDSAVETCSQAKLPVKLEESLKKWSSNGNRCIWFKVDIKDAFFVPALAQKGFTFHHARDGFVMMYKWLPQDSKPNLPPACHTNLGAGALVFNDQKQVLTVLEKHNEVLHWKLPGGYAEKGEHIIDTAIREVKEETGVDAAYLSLVTFRHTHNMMFGNSDIYVLLMMKALTKDIIISNEVRDCKWMDIEEYSKHPHVHEFNRLVVHKALEYRNRNLKLDLEKRTVVWPKITREMRFLLVKDVGY